MSNKRTLYFRPKAEHDLELIWDYTHSTWGLVQAEQYVERLHKTMIELLEYPEIGSKYASSNGEYRKLVVDKHVIYYRDTDNEILIVRILHSKMNRDNLL